MDHCSKTPPVYEDELLLAPLEFPGGTGDEIKDKRSVLAGVGPVPLHCISTFLSGEKVRCIPHGHVGGRVDTLDCCGAWEAGSFSTGQM